MPIDKNGNEIPQSTHNLVGYRESLQLFYSPNHELIESITIKDEGLKVVKTVTHYYYDAFGRRIGKSSSTQKSSKLNQRGQLVRFPSNLSSLNTTDRPQRNNTLMLWDGNRQIQEITDDFTFTTVYEQNSFVPVARIVERQPHLLEQAKRDEQAEWAKYENMQLTKRSKANIHHKAHTGLRIYHYHTDHLGTPQELTNDRGEVVWLNYQMAWGGSFSQLNNVHNLDGLDISADELQPFRFQGQFYDGETGLHYNRFRYYDSDVGMFIQRDPIGLLGGSNVFQYAPNPIGWIDPWGLHSCTLSELDNKAIEAWDTLPAGKGKNLTTVAVGQGESGKLYVSTSSPYVPKKIKEWANSNNVTVVQSKKPNVHAEESLHNFSDEKMVEIGSSKPICLDCERGMKKNDIGFNPLNTKGERSNNRKSSDYTGRW